MKKRKSKKPWSQNFKPEIARSKKAHFLWKQDKENKQLQKERKEAKRQLRAAQRRHAAMFRQSEQEKIMEAHEFDRQTFYKLVKKQRKGGRTSAKVDFGNKEVTQVEGWAKYFQDLATLKDNPDFDQSHKESIEMQTLLLEDMYNDAKPEAPITEAETKKLIAKLKNGKAGDIFGVKAEHLKHGPPILVTAVTEMVNNTLKTGTIPSNHKIGAVTAVPKPGKVATNPDNHRRITVGSICGKVAEKEVTKRSRNILNPKQSKLQFGFTEGCSPSTCALVLTEAMSEAMDKGEMLYITFMDIKKAFDTVWHSSMLTAINDHGINGTLWNIFRDMYTDIKSQVKLKGELSDPICELQGIKQGAESSTDLFKAKSNPMIDRSGSHPVAYRIGSIPVGAPTTADDTALISSSRLGAQVQIGIAQLEANQNRYCFSNQKTKVMVVNQKKDPENPNLKLNNNIIDVSEQEKHLGIERTPNHSAEATVDSRIKQSRRAVYSLAGSGLHGLNGVGPKVSFNMVQTYITPILTYGLESLILKDKDYETLESYYRSLLRQIQHLPENTAIPAIYLLLGCIPIQGQVHIKMLTFFGNITRRPGTVEYEIVQRQLAVKNITSQSWVTQIRCILDRYDLPSAFQLLDNPPSKQVWKKTVKSEVNKYWMEELQSKAKEMKTLSHLDIQECKPGKIHDVWNHNSDPLAAYMATIKARLLVQRYPLGYSHYSGKKKGKSCILCKGTTETIEHFLLQCPILNKIRTQYLTKLYHILPAKNLPQNSDELVRMLLTPRSALSGVEEEPTPRSGLSGEYEGLVEQIESVSRRFIYKLHNERAIQMGGEKSLYSFTRAIKSVQ